MSSLINIPDFLVNDLNLSKISKLKKLFLFIYGKSISILLKLPSQKVIIFVLNLIYRKSGKLLKEGSFYVKEYSQNRKIYYPNTRYLRVAKGVDYQFSKILSDYCVEELNLKSGNVVIDCGANVGELYLALEYKNINVKYYAFEPDIDSFECLKKNIKGNDNLKNIGLSDRDGNATLYLGTSTGDSSMEYFGSENENTIEIKRLDSFNFNKVHLLKIDAEGHELEVLKGASDILNNIDFISVDYGLEKGLDQISTIVEVTNYLYQNNFHLYKANLNRNVGLFKNKEIE
tara:strand:- start:1181 stop:2044 length:864 start_codon:yes stop_codon:yes gene_type:complete